VGGILRRRFNNASAAAAGAACLTCGSPVCRRHRSSEFAKQDIVICSHCAPLFSMNYLVHHVADAVVVDENNQHPPDDDGREQQPQHHDQQQHHPRHPNGQDQQPHPDTKRRINRVLEVYDRSLLVLRYSLQYIDEVAYAMRNNTSRHNKVGLGSSATGMVAGGLGVAAACTIWTPVGPPLLLASILFGGGAAAVNAGSEAANYRCEPNKMADRILTLHSIVSSVARLPGALDHRLMMKEERERHHQQLARNGADQEATEGGPGGGGGGGEAAAGDNDALIFDDRHHRDEGQSRLHWTRTAMNGLKPLTMGALSAVSIVTEAREMKRAVDKIRAGNPCDKAERLLTIKVEMEQIPHTEDLSHQLQLIMSRPKEY
jgi:hypothetical protein